MFWLASEELIYGKVITSFPTSRTAQYCRFLIQRLYRTTSRGRTRSHDNRLHFHLVTFVPPVHQSPELTLKHVDELIM